MFSSNDDGEQFLNRIYLLKQLPVCGQLHDCGCSSTKVHFLLRAAFFNMLLIPSESTSTPTSSPDDSVPDSLYIVFGVVCGFCLLMVILFGAVCIHKRTSNSFFW